MKRNSKKYRSVLAAIMAATVIFTTAAASPTYASEQTESEEVSAEVIVDTASESEEAETTETIETESQQQEADGDEVSSEETNAAVETTEAEETETETDATEAEPIEDTTEVEATETVTETEEPEEGTEVTGETEAAGTVTTGEEKETIAEETGTEAEAVDASDENNVRYRITFYECEEYDRNTEQDMYNQQYYKYDKFDNTKLESKYSYDGYGSSKVKLGDIVEELPTLPDFRGEKFIGWMDYDGNKVDENTELVQIQNWSVSNYSFYPVFEKQEVFCEKIYINSKGKCVTEYETIKCASDEDKSEILKRLSPPKDMDGTFTGWTEDYSTKHFYKKMTVAAVPEGKAIAYGRAEWMDKNLIRRYTIVGGYVDASDKAQFDAYSVCWNKLNKLVDLKKEMPEEFSDAYWSGTSSGRGALASGQVIVDIHFEPYSESKWGVVYSYLSGDGKIERKLIASDYSNREITLPSELPGYDKVTWQRACPDYDYSTYYVDAEMPAKLDVGERWQYFRADPSGTKYTLPEEDNPLVDIEEPSDDNNTTPGDTDTPSDDNKPSDDNNTPSDDSNTSTGDTTTPSGDSNTSTGDTTTPSDNNSASAGENNSSTSAGKTGTDNSSNENQTVANDSQKTSDVTVLTAEKVSDTVNKINAASTGAAVSVTMGTAKIVPVEVLKALKGKDANVVLNMGGYSWTINGKNITADTLKAINLGVKLDQNAIAQNVVATVADGQPTRQLSLDYSGEFGFKASLNLNLGAENAGQFGNLYYYNSTGQLVFMNAGKIDVNGNVSLSFTHASDYVIVIDKDRTAQEAAQSPKTGENFLVLPVSVMVMSALGLAFLYAKKRENF